MVEDTKKETTKKPITKISQVIIRDYPKIVFFYPLLFTSLILWIIQLFFLEPVPILGLIWMIIFTCNVFVMAFDFNSTKFFVLVLVIIITVILLIFLVPWSSIMSAEIDIIEFNIGITTYFYLIITVILGITLALVIFVNHFDYWKVERNEIYHKSGVFTSAERFPVQNLIFKKEIPDIFEYLALRSGTITLRPSKDKVIHLGTVLNIDKKAKQLDYLLSHMKVEVDELDK